MSVLPKALAGAVALVLSVCASVAHAASLVWDPLVETAPGSTLATVPWDYGSSSAGVVKSLSAITNAVTTGTFLVADGTGAAPLRGLITNGLGAPGGAIASLNFATVAGQVYDAYATISDLSGTSSGTYSGTWGTKAFSGAFGDGPIVAKYTFTATGPTSTINWLVNATSSSSNFAALTYAELDFVKVSGAVPEPATWALMLAGFGLVGGAMRQGRSSDRRVRFNLT